MPVAHSLHVLIVATTIPHLQQVVPRRQSFPLPQWLQSVPDGLPDVNVGSENWHQSLPNASHPCLLFNLPLVPLHVLLVSHL